MKKGFTLIEMLIVMAVVSILIAIIIPSYRGMQNDAWNAKAVKEAQTIAVAVESYYRHHNRYPNRLDELLTARPTILYKLPDDPWKTSEETDGTYGYIKGTTAGFGDYYIIYSKSIDNEDDVKNRSNVTGGALHLPAGSDDIVQSNLPVEKDL